MDRPIACACSDGDCLRYGCKLQRRYGQHASQRGWTCPKCGSVWSPTTPGCFACNRATALSDLIAGDADLIDGGK